MGREGHQRQSKSQMGYPNPPDHQGRAKDHRPKDLVGSSPSKAPHQGFHTKRRTPEGALEAQSRPGQSPSSWHGPQHPGHKLAVCSLQTQKTPVFLVEEHTRRMAKREAGFVQMKTDQHRGAAEVASIREPPHH